jgi:hypothetical protein
MPPILKVQKFFSNSKGPRFRFLTTNSPIVQPYDRIVGISPSLIGPYRDLSYSKFTSPSDATLPAMRSGYFLCDSRDEPFSDDIVTC